MANKPNPRRAHHSTAEEEMEVARWNIEQGNTAFYISAEHIEAVTDYLQEEYSFVMRPPEDGFCLLTDVG